MFKQLRNDLLISGFALYGLVSFAIDVVKQL